MALEAFLFGFTLAIAIGPIAILIVNASLSRGLTAGLACGLGAALADFSFAAAAFLLGGELLVLLSGWRPVIEPAAAVLLCAMGLWMMRKILIKPDPAAPVKPARTTGLFGTYALTMTNPFTIMLFASWLASRSMDTHWDTGLLLALAVFAGSLSVQVSLAAGGALLRLWFARPRVMIGINLLSGAGIFAFGLHAWLRLYT